MNDAPLISIMISTHNRAAYLQEAIQSVLEQTLTDFELIICDDASTDHTQTVCQAYAAADGRVRVIRHATNVGMIANWNSGLAASCGRFFAKLDDDNRYLPQFLEATVAQLQTHPDADFAFTDEWFINEHGERQEALTDSSSRHYGRAALTAGPQKDTPLVAVQQSAGINASLFKRETLIKAGGFRAFGGNIADLDVFLNLANRGCRACYVTQRLAEYRVHEEMGTADLISNATKARASVAIWEACEFQDSAELVRRAKLATAYTSLSRVLTLQGDVSGARDAIKRAWRLAPCRPRILAAASVLYLPEPVLARIIRRRYAHTRTAPSS